MASDKLGLEAILENMPQCAWLQDREGRYLAVNKAFEKMWGWKTGEVIGKTDFEIWPREVAEKKRAIDLEVIGHGRAKTLEQRLAGPDGREIYVEASVSPVIDGNGHILGTTGVAQDITHRIHVNSQLKDSEDRLKIIFEYAPDACYLFDLSGAFLDGNKAAEELCGYNKEELIGKNFLKLKLIALSDIPKAGAALARSAMGLASRSEEYTINRKDGSVAVAEIRLYPVKIKGTLQVLGCARDITEQKKAQEALHKAHQDLEVRVRERTAELAKSQAYAQQILAAITDYIYTVTVKDGMAVATTHQPTCFAVTGYTVEEFKAHPTLWESMVFEEDRPRVLEFAKALLAGQHVKPIEHRLLHKNGQVRWVRNTPVLHHDPSGRLLSYDGIISDITERKDAEIARAESLEKAARANRAKDQFLANMSHEIRTPLNAIIGFSDLLKSTDLDPVQRGYVKTLREGGELLLSLLTDVLDFSRMASGEARPGKVQFDLERLIRGVVRMYEKKFDPKHVRLFCTIGEDLPNGFRGEPSRIRQVLMHLLSNAVKFTEQGEIEVRVSLDGKAESQGPRHEVRVRIDVRDTGIGLSRDKYEAVFSAFEQADVSTTRKFGGAGLGLSISRELVRSMGGTIEVRSEPGKGSTFSFILPLEVETGIKEIQIFPLKDNELEGKRILILDDDAVTRMIFSQYCEQAKMTVACSLSSARDALQWLSEQTVLPDIFLADLLMPGLDGYEMAEMIRREKKYENMKLLAVTGDALGGAAFRAKRSGFDAYLSKPTSKENLIKVIKTVLGDKREKSLPVEIVTQYTADELSSKGLKILVVEDNPASQDLLSIILRSFGFSVEIASDGREAVEKVKQGLGDLILMDLQMPVMGGIEATQIIRDQFQKTVPILALTAGVTEDDKATCLAAGMNDYLAKPIEIDKLKDKIFHWIKNIP